MTDESVIPRQGEGMVRAMQRFNPNLAVHPVHRTVAILHPVPFGEWLNRDAILALLTEDPAP